MNEAKLREYAKLIVKIGANVQKGQRVRLQAGVDQVLLATMVTEECYKAGASRNTRYGSELGGGAPQTDDRRSSGPHFH